MSDTETTLTAPETAHVEQPASSVAETPSKKPLAEMASWDEYRASIQPADAPIEAAPVEPVEAPETPETPEATEPQPEPLEGFTLDGEGRLHRPDGTFASAEEVEQFNAAIPEPEPEPEAPPVETHTVELRARDGSTKAIEVDDPELAELLRTNANDGMRASEYRQRVAKVDAQLAELNAFRTMLETNPEAVILDAMPEAKQVAIATALIARYWDHIVPTIQHFDTDPVSRIQAVADAKEAARTQRDTYQQTITANQHAAQLAQSVSALIPETADDALAQQFMADAEADVLRAVQSGRQVTPENVGEILAHRLKLYGFTNHQSAAPAAPKAAVRFSASSSRPTPAVPTATPTGEKAAQLAERAKATQQRIQQSQQARQRAAAVPPSGAGAAPVRTPLVPKGASIEDASKALKKLGNNWGAYTG